MAIFFKETFSIIQISSRPDLASGPKASDHLLSFSCLLTPEVENPDTWIKVTLRETLEDLLRKIMQALQVTLAYFSLFLFFLTLSKCKSHSQFTGHMKTRLRLDSVHGLQFTNYCSRGLLWNVRVRSSHHSKNKIKRVESFDTSQQREREKKKKIF